MLPFGIAQTVTSLPPQVATSFTDTCDVCSPPFAPHLPPLHEEHILDMRVLSCIFIAEVEQMLQRLVLSSGTLGTFACFAE